MKDKKEYPILTRDDCPNKLYSLLSVRIDEAEDKIVKKVDIVRSELVNTNRRQVNIQASTRLLWLVVIGIAMSLLLTSC